MGKSRTMCVQVGRHHGGPEGERITCTYEAGDRMESMHGLPEVKFLDRERLFFQCRLWIKCLIDLRGVDGTVSWMAALDTTKSLLHQKTKRKPL